MYVSLLIVFYDSETRITKKDYISSSSSSSSSSSLFSSTYSKRRVHAFDGSTLVDEPLECFSTEREPLIVIAAEFLLL